MEEFKRLDDITQPDERHGLLGALTGMHLSLEGLYSVVEKIELNQSVPVELRRQFNVARNLTLYTWFSYSLDPVAQLKSYILIEHALNIKDGNRDRSLKKMLQRAVSEGWLLDSGFRHVTFDPKEPQKYCNSLVETLPSLRNEAAHGSNMLSQSAVSHLQICADFINQLFK